MKPYISEQGELLAEGQCVLGELGVKVPVSEWHVNKGSLR